MSTISSAGAPTGGGGAKPDVGTAGSIRPDSGKSIRLRQLRLPQDQSLPQGRTMCFATSDWKSGDPKKDGNLWLIDIVAPFGARPKGAADAALKELRDQLFLGKRFKMLQPAPSGQGVAVVES